jgi:hypothetical protein
MLPDREASLVESPSVYRVRTPCYSPRPTICPVSGKAVAYGYGGQRAGASTALAMIARPWLISVRNLRAWRASRNGISRLLMVSTGRRSSILDLDSGGMAGNNLFVPGQVTALWPVHAYRGRTSQGEQAVSDQVRDLAKEMFGKTRHWHSASCGPARTPCSPTGRTRRPDHRGRRQRLRSLTAPAFVSGGCSSAVLSSASRCPMRSSAAGSACAGPPGRLAARRCPGRRPLPRRRGRRGKGSGFAAAA